MKLYFQTITGATGPNVKGLIEIIVVVIGLRIKVVNEDIQRFVGCGWAMHIIRQATAIASSHHKDTSRSHQVLDRPRNVVLAIVRPQVGTHAHIDDTGFIHTVGISKDVLDAIHNLSLRDTGIQSARRTQNDVGTRGHAAIAVHMGAGSDTGHVSAMSPIGIIGHCINLLSHKNRSWQCPAFHNCWTSLSVHGVIYPDDTCLALVSCTLESLVLVIKPSVNHTYDHATSIISLGQSVCYSIQQLSGMGDTQCAIGAQVHISTYLHIVHSAKLRYTGQDIQGNARCDKTVKCTIHLNPH